MSGAEVLACALRAACEAAQCGATVLRDVQGDREANNNSNASLEASMKDPTDSRTFVTVADKRAQDAILVILRSRCPSAKIVCEEDEEEDEQQQQQQPAPEVPRLDHTDSDILAIPEGLYDGVEEQDLCFFVDPLDGTREFVQGRIESCQTLIGIAWRGRAIGGVMVLPFHNGYIGAEPFSAAARGVILCGVVGGSITGLPSDLSQCGTFSRTHPQLGTDNGIVLATSAKVTHPALIDATSALGASELVQVGGCGNKILRILTGQADVALLNLASSLWDTCATQALIEAAGGKLSTLPGFPIEHIPNAPNVANIFGAIATCSKVNHIDICARLAALPSITALVMPVLSEANKNVPQALDITRDINGRPIMPQGLNLAIGTDTIESYSAPASGAVRYKQSYACRMFLQHKQAARGNEKKDEADDAVRVNSVFFKRIVLREMPYAMTKTTHKLKRDIRSYKVEAAVLSSPFVRTFAALPPSKPHEVASTDTNDSTISSKETNAVALPLSVSMALPYQLEQIHFEDEPKDARFTVMLEDLSPDRGWTQHALLEYNNLCLTLRSLARWHAFFWLGANIEQVSNPELVALKEAVWPAGGYVHPGQQPEGQIEALPARWARMYKEFEKYLPEGTDESIGTRLQKVAAVLSEIVHGVSGDGTPYERSERNGGDLAGLGSSAYLTLVHGDPKSPNFFFREAGEAGDAGVNKQRVGVIDFQWVGCGIGASDVAYCIAACGSPEVLSMDGKSVDGLLRCYHDEFLNSFKEFHVLEAEEAKNPAPVLEFDVFVKQFRAALLDLGRVVVADHWKTITVEVMLKREGALAFNAYNKSMHVAMWIIARIQEYLADFE